MTSPKPENELDDPAVAGPHRQKLLVGEVPAGFGDDGDVMGIGVGVDPDDDFRMFVCHDETALTFRCVRWNKGARRPGGQTRR